MEYPSINDFYLKLKALYNKKGNFIDYVLVQVSENFNKATNICPSLVLNKKISEIVVENENIFGLKDYYFNIIPKSRSKHSLFIKDLKRWYFINIIADKNDKEESMIIFYNDITDIRKSSQRKIVDSNISENNIYHLKDGAILYFRDKLTGLYNKTFFEEELFRLDTRRQLPISVVTANVNGLKLINDAFGRNMGDRALIKASEIMKSSFRKEDIISRAAGDTFLVLLPKTSEEAASLIVDRIKKYCEKNLLDFMTLSISLGVATKEIEMEDIHEILKKSEEKMFMKKLRESKSAKEYIIDLLKNKLEKITFETKAHYERLKELCLMMAKEMRLSAIQNEELKQLCEFHDIGKISISKSILQKEGALNKKEWEDVKRHSQVGYNIVKEFKEPSSIDELVLIHHERWDGNGYPGLFKGEQIPIVARIFAIADAYEAMVNERPYKNKMTNKEALQEIKEKSGKQFDPSLSKIFIDLMDKEEKIV